MSVSGSVLEPARLGIDRLRRPFTAHATEREATVAHGARTIAICLGAIVIAFNYSLSTLVRTLSLDTPLAYLGLVPVIAFMLAVVRVKPSYSEPSIHDRQVDYIVGVPLLLASLLINLLLPVKYSAMFWVWRIDLVALPLFAAGAVALLFGVRTLWRVKLAVVFLLLAWPLPYTALLLNELQRFTDATISAVKVALHVVPVAHPIPSADGSLFQIQHGATGFPVSVASACSGVNGMVGYALVSLAFLALVKGPVVRKLLWLGLGLVVIWLLNVARIVAIFAVGQQWGQTVAIDGLHPVLGLITFCFGVLLMMALLGRFGLELPTRRIVDAERESSLSEVRRAVPKTRTAVMIVIAFALFTGIANASLRSFDLVANVDGTPKLSAFLTRPARPAGWQVQRIGSYEWSRQFFGGDSNWFRYRYTWDGTTLGGVHSSVPVIADVISTSDLSSFSAYGIEACYSFHGYKLRSVDRVDLGGVIANVVSYRNTTEDSDWTNVYWIWPVKTPTGETRYERVNLLLTDSASVKLVNSRSTASAPQSPGLGIAHALGSGSVNAGNHAEQVRQFLVAFAGQLVHDQAKAPETK